MIRVTKAIITRPTPSAFWQSQEINTNIALTYPILLSNTLRSKQNDRHFANDLLNVFFNEKEWISITIWPKFVPKRPVNNIPSMVRKMVCCRLGEKPLIILTNDI